MSQLALARFLAKARRAAGVRGLVDVLITSSRELQELNRRFRHKDKPTDVLSFPSAAAPMTNGLQGDIAISAEIASENAERLGHSMGDELKVLVLHGVLHLAGYDHETDDGEMARKEAALRKQLRLPESLIERTQEVPSAAKAASKGRLTARLKPRPFKESHSKPEPIKERAKRGRKR